MTHFKPRLNGRTKPLLLWLALLGFLMGLPAAGWPHDPSKEPDHFGRIEETPDGVFIKAEDKQLSSVLHAVELKSGIKISLAGHLNNDRLTAVVNQPDWASAIRRLLINYSTIEIGSHPLLKVRVLARTGDAQVLDSSKPWVKNREDGTRVQNGFVYQPVKRIKKKIWANESIPFTQTQLQAVVGDKFYQPLSKKLLEDHVYDSLLSKHGIKSEKDLGNFSKGLAVRTEAGKMLRVLQKREALGAKP